MKINKEIAEPIHREVSPARVLLRQVIGDVRKGMEGSWDSPDKSGNLLQARRNFFERYYVKPDTEGRLPTGINTGAALSIAECELLSFMLDKHLRNEKVYLLCDHAGRGKSTLLNYVCYWLIPSEQDLRKRLAPGYLSLYEIAKEIRGLAKSGEVYSLLNEKYYNALYAEVLWPYLSQNWRAVLSWADRRAAALDLDAQFNSDVLDRIEEEGFPSYFGNLDKNQRVRIGMAGAAHCSLSTDRAICLILDDADRLSIDEQRIALEYLLGWKSLGLPGVMAMRRSTFVAFRREISDKEPMISAPLNVTQETLKQIMANRLDNARELVRLKYFGEHPVEAVEIVDGFVRTLSHRDSEDLLVKLSNENLHSLFAKYQLIADSDYLTDKEILRELMVKHAVGDSRRVGAQVWFVYAALFGNYRGTFSSEEDAVVKAGLVNLFCTRNRNTHPFTFFARLHLLVSLWPHRDEAHCRSVLEMKDRYQLFFGDNTHFTEVFKRALRRVFDAGLIHTHSCERYQDKPVFMKEIVEDQVYLSTAGAFSVSQLIFRIDYLWQIKDDIDWPKRVEFRAAGPHVTPNEKIMSTLESLGELMLMEIRLLEEIKEIGDRNPRAQIGSCYAAEFSPRCMGRDSVSFTREMQREFLDYLDSYRPDFRQTARGGDLIRRLDELGSTIDDLDKIY